MARRRRSFFFDNINKMLLTNTTKKVSDVKDDKDNNRKNANEKITRGDTQTLIDTEIAALANSAPATLNTLDELAAALGDDANFSTTVTTSLSNRLRIDVNNQGLTSTQKSNATTNLGLGTAATTASSDYATSAQGTKADTAHGWGNHASAGYTTYGNSDVDSHLNQSNPTSGYVLSWNGSDYAWVEQSGGVTSYNDLTDKPTIPTNNNQLTNGAGYITSSFISDKGSAASLDLNDLTASSDEGYYSWASTQPTNSPGWTYGGVLVLRDNNQNNQIAFGGSTSKMAIRRANSGSYGSWAEVWTTNNLTATNKSNYDTAYGWGNHASAGYLTSSDLSGYATLSGSNSFTNTYNEFGNGTGSVSNNGSWHGRVNIAGTSHARLDVQANGDGIITTMYSHNGHGSGRVGTMSNHPISLMSNGSVIVTFATPNVANNIDVRSGTTGSAGMVLKDSGGTFRSQWYGTGADNGFLTGEWGAWDLRKTINGQLLLRVSGTDYTTMHTGNIGSTAYTQTGTRTMNGYYVGGADGHREKGIYGNYNSYRINNIWSMGTSYKISSDGSGFGNLYGMAYTYHNRVYTSNTMGQYHQMVWCNNGTPYCALGRNVWTSGNVTAYSDIRVKENLEIIPNALEKVKKLNGYTFDRTDIETDNEGNTPKKRQAGVVAQEVLEVLPEVVSGNEDDPDGHLSVAYGNMVGLLIEAIKEQQEQIEELKARLQ